MKRLFCAPLLLLAVFHAACLETSVVTRNDSATRSTEEISAEISSLYKEYEASVSAGDLDRMLQIFDDDVVSMPPNEPPFQGKDALRAWQSDYFQNYTMHEQFLITEIRAARDWAVVSGTYFFNAVPKGEGERTSNQGSFIAVLDWTSENGWRIKREIWNGD